MDAAIIRQLFLALAALQGIYAIIVIALYLDLRSKIYYPIPRLIIHLCVFIFIFHVYQWLTEVETLEFLLPLHRKHTLIPSPRSMLPPLVAQALPLVLESIRLLLTIAAQISIIDKLLYIVSRCRIPFPLVIGFVSAMATMGAMVLYITINKPVWHIQETLANMEKIETYLIEPLGAILLFLTVFAGIMGIKAIVHHIQERKQF